jgi:hypothetical protein
MQKFDNDLENEDLSIEFDFKMKIFGEDYFPKKLVKPEYLSTNQFSE